MAPRVGFEPTAIRLTVECSTAELSGSSPVGRGAPIAVSAGLARFGKRRLNLKLLGDDAFVEGVAAVEQEGEAVVVRDGDADLGDLAQLLLVGDGGNGALVGLEHPEA